MATVPTPTYKKTLDKSRDYGTSHPPENGVSYWQDGYPFDHECKIVDDQLTPEQRTALAKKVAPQQPNPPAPGGKGKAQQSKNVSMAEFNEPDVPPEEGADNSLNLTEWLKGEADYQFPDVQKAVKDRYKVWKTGKRDLVLFLVEEQKLVGVDELSDEFKGLAG